jgi:predicted lipoprotein with Yx(FWY)xxD motif
MSEHLNFTRCLGALTILTLSAACAKKDQTVADTSTAAMTASADTTALGATTTPATGATTTPAAPITLAVANKAGLGAYLTDEAGRAIYVLDDGTGTTVACTGTCLSEFQPVAGKPIAGAHAAPLKENLISVTTLPDGTVQATYAGKPLFYSTADQAGSTVSVQAKKSGTITSFLVSPSGTEIKKKPTP